MEISVSRALLKKDLKACLLAGLIDKGVLPDVEVMQQGESSVAVTGESPVAPVTPLNAHEVGPPLSMPKFEPLSISTDMSSMSLVGACVKVRLALLQLEAQDNVQARKHENTNCNISWRIISRQMLKFGCDS